MKLLTRHNSVRSGMQAIVILITFSFGMLLFESLIPTSESLQQWELLAHGNNDCEGEQENEKSEEESNLDDCTHGNLNPWSFDFELPKLFYTSTNCVNACLSEVHTPPPEFG